MPRGPSEDTSHRLALFAHTVLPYIPFHDPFRKLPGRYAGATPTPSDRRWSGRASRLPTPTLKRSPGGFEDRNRFRRRRKAGGFFTPSYPRAML
jgi:hypothetical protein